MRGGGPAGLLRGMGTVGEVGGSSFSFFDLSPSSILTHWHPLLGGCCPAQGVVLLFVCCGVRRTVSKSELWSPNRLTLWGELIWFCLTLLTVPRMSLSLLSSLGLLWLLLWYLLRFSSGLVLGEPDLLLSPSSCILSAFPGVPRLSDVLLFENFSWLLDLLYFFS